jgi:hypothetical protein
VNAERGPAVAFTGTAGAEKVAGTLGSTELTEVRVPSS